MKVRKQSFYPSEEVERELKDIPRGHISERVNELILKGLSTEKRDQIAFAYQQYNLALGAESNRERSSKIMSAGAFTPEDETEDFF